MAGNAWCPIDTASSGPTSNQMSSSGAGDHSVEICKEICYAAYQDSSRLCNMMSSAKNRRICWAEASEQLSQCNRACEGR